MCINSLSEEKNSALQSKLLMSLINTNLLKTVLRFLFPSKISFLIKK